MVRPLLRGRVSPFTVQDLPRPGGWPQNNGLTGAAWPGNLLRSFTPMRTHFCGLVDETLIGQTVTLAGWTDVARNLGGVCFIDLRDHEGIVQVTVEPENAEVFKVAASLGYEDVLQVEGVVRRRHAVNDKIRTGQVEIVRGLTAGQTVEVPAT